MECRVWIAWWIILYIRYSRLFWIYIKKAWEKNTSIKIDVNKIENRITFETKTGYYLDLLTPETMKLLRTTKSKITKKENGKNVPRLESNEAVSIHCNFVNIVVNKIHEPCIHLFLIYPLVNY